MVAGEVSGDLHAANLVRALRAQRPNVQVWGVGGAALRSAGAQVVFPAESLGAMGLIEAAGTLPSLARAWRAMTRGFRDHPPDLFLPVDFSGLNLRLAGAAARQGIPVAYYIPPKVWAWGPWRVRTLRNRVDEALVVLPFEQDYLRDRGVPATYVGSPVVDHLAPRRFAREADVVGLLPGSRLGEVARLWPLLLEVAGRLAERRALRFLVPCAPGLPRQVLEEPLRGRALPVEILDGRSQEVLERSRACLVASGTATLECALLDTPLVAVYRVSGFTYMVGRALVRTPFVSLPNLVAGRRLVPEFIQTGPAPVAEALESLLDDGPQREAMLRGFAEVQRRLGGPGASRRAAARVLARLPGGESPAGGRACG